MESLGKYLKKIRKERGVSLEDLSSRTRIREKYLRALEEDQLEQVPNQVFAKGFVRAYIKALSLNEAEVLKRYEKEIISYFKQDEPIHPVPDPKTSSAEQNSPNFNGKRGMVAVGAGVLVIGLWVVFSNQTEMNSGQVSQPSSVRKVDFTPKIPERLPDREKTSSGSQENRSPGNDPQRGGDFPEARGTGDRPTEIFPPNLKEGISPPPGGGSTPTLDLNLVIEATERSWVFLTIDDVDTREMILEAGERVQLEAEEKFLITLGNSGGVSLELNNTPIDISGETGKVRRDILLSPETIKGIKNKENFSVTAF